VKDYLIKPLPDNTLPMMTGLGQFGPIEMGGMTSVVKVREGLADQRLLRSRLVQASPGHDRLRGPGSSRRGAAAKRSCGNENVRNGNAGPIPAAATNGPMVRGNLAPQWSMNPPDQRDSPPMISVKGKKAAPACSYPAPSWDLGTRPQYTSHLKAATAPQIVKRGQVFRAGSLHSGRSEMGHGEKNSRRSAPRWNLRSAAIAG
jgi:hypothetical protein